MTNYYAVFNSNDLAVDPYEILGIEANNLPSANIKKYVPVRSDGMKVTSKNFGEKKITIRGRVKANDFDTMQTYQDSLKAKFAGVEQTFDTKVGGVIRRYTATLDNLVFSGKGYICDFVATLIAQPFGTDTSSTNLTITSPRTTASVSDSNTFGGSFKGQPAFDFTLVMCDPFWSAQNIDIANAALNKRIRLTRAWSWYERVVIDPIARTVSIYPTTKTEIDKCEVITGWTSANTLALEIVNMKEGVGCLKVSMAGAAIITDFTKLNFTPTIDFSSGKGKVIIPIFLPTPDAGAISSIDFIVGSDATLVNNFAKWNKTTQWDGSALATNAWNFLEVDLASASTDTGTPVKGSIKSMAIKINGVAATMKLTGVLVDYLTIQKAGAVATILDYEGNFPEFEPGSGAILISDGLTSRKMTCSASYVKRYI